MPSLTFTTFDSFTRTRYAGNPCAIIHLPLPSQTTITQSQKQAIASEFNLSEVLFLHHPPPNAIATASPQPITIDIFTSHAEIPFAGHPTIAAAFWILRHTRRNDNAHQSNPSAILRTKAGLIPISAAADTLAVCASIPHNLHIHTTTYAPHPSWAGSGADAPPSSSPLVSIVKGMTFVLVQLPHVEALGRAAGGEVKANMYGAVELDDEWQEGFIGTFYYVLLGEDDEGYWRLRTRMFGSREDPATGSASCALASYLALRAPHGQRGETYKYKLTQGVEMGRRSEIQVEVTKNESGDAIKTVILGGEAAKVMEGTLDIDG